MVSLATVGLGQKFTQKNLSSKNCHQVFSFKRMVALGANWVKLRVAFSISLVRDLNTCYCTSKQEIFRRISNRQQTADSTMETSDWKDSMTDAGVKVTHLNQNRGQAQRELDKADPAHTSRMAGYTSADVKQSRAQNQSYLFRPPVPALAQRGGWHCDHRDSTFST
jgi:hypothetical protein